MIIDYLNLSLLGTEAGHIGCPILAFNLSWRNPRSREKDGCARIIFSQTGDARFVYLIDDKTDHNITVEILFERLWQLDTSILEKNLSDIAKLWNVTTEDLIDRIIERRPEDW